MLRGPPNDSKWSAHRKSLGTTELDRCLLIYLEEENSIDGLGRVDVLHDVFGDGGVG